MSFLGKKFTRQQWTHMFFYSLQAPLGFLAGYFGRDNLPLFIGIVVFWVINSFQVQALFWHAINKRPRSGSPDYLAKETVGPDAEIITNASGGKQSKTVGRFELMGGKALMRLAKVLEYGAGRYSPNNWRKIPYESHINHAIQHLAALLDDDKQDDHLGHAFCRLMMAIETENPYYEFKGTPVSRALDKLRKTYIEPDTLVKETPMIPSDLIPMLGESPMLDMLRKAAVRLTLDDVPHCPWCGAPCPYCEYGTEMAGDLSKDTKIIELPEQTEITAGLIADYETLAELVSVWKQQALSPELNESQKGQLYKRILSATRARTDIGAILLARGVKAAPKEKDVSQLIAHAKEIKVAREKVKFAGNAQGTP